MKKAQATQQIFIYILAILIVGLIFLFGYDAVSKLRKQAEIISSADLKNKIIGKVTEGMSYKAVTKLELNLGDFDRICWVDLNEPAAGGLCNPDKTEYSRQACDAWKAGSASKANVFLIGSNKFETIYAGDEENLKPYVKVDDPTGCRCFEGDKVTIRLEGKGDSVLVSEWE